MLRKVNIVLPSGILVLTMMSFILFFRPMTVTKGKQAMSTWKTVLFCPDVQREDVVHFLVDSMLCYHSGFWQGKISMID